MAGSDQYVLWSDAAEEEWIRTALGPDVEASSEVVDALKTMLWLHSEEIRNFLA
jgi:hypothetical protein